MSILTDLIEKKINWSQAATKIENWITGVANKDPIVASTIAAIETDVKQAASDAITIGETALGTVLLPFVKTLEPGLDAILATYLGPLGVALAPVTNDAIDKVSAAINAEVTAWSLKAKAGLAAGAGVAVLNVAQPAPPLAGGA